MVAYKSKHRIIVLIRVTKDVEIEIEEAGRAKVADLYKGGMYYVEM